MTPVYVKANNETMMEARVFRHETDRFAVALFDLDAAETVPVFAIFRDAASAIDFADQLIAR